MPTRQKKRSVAHLSGRQQATQVHDGNIQLDRRTGVTPRNKVRAWINSLDPHGQKLPNHETDIYRGHKRKARDENVIDLVSDSDEIERPSSKKLKALASGPQLLKRATSRGGNRDQDGPVTVPDPSRTYIVLSDSDDDGGAPITPTPRQRTTASVTGLGSVRGLSVVSQRHRIQTHPRSGLQTAQQSIELKGLLRGQQQVQSTFQAPQWLLQQPVSQGVQQDAQNHLPVARRLFQQAQPGTQNRPVQHAPPGFAQDIYRGPKTTSSRVQQLHIRPAQGLQDPFQQGIQQAIEQVVHQPQYLGALPQETQQKALRQELEKTAQNFFTRAQFSPNLPAIQGGPTSTDNNSSSESLTHLSPRRKARATPRKKVQVISSSLPADYFCSLPREVRENIFRHLLISNKPVQVSKIWTDVARTITRRAGRGRRERDEEEDETPTTIDARILSVCRQVHLEGARILYSENTFFYKLRDGDSVPHYALTNASPRSRRPPNTGNVHNWHATWLAANNDNPINFAKYGPLMRHLRIELEPNRSTDEKYENLLVCALEALVSRPGLPISLHVLDLSISPSYYTTPTGRYLSTAPFFAPGHRVMKALSKITANYLHLDVHVDATTPKAAPAAGQPAAAVLPDDDENDDDAHQRRHLETTIDQRFTPRHMAAEPPSDAAGADLWARDKTMLESRKARGRRAETCLAHLRRRIEGACANPDKAIWWNWFDDKDDADYLRMGSATGWVGTSEVQDADEFEDRVLIMKFATKAGKVKATKVD